jgi:MFS family permease
MLHRYSHHLHFIALKNKKLDALYITVAILELGAGLISVFIPIYFWKLGIPLWGIIFFYLLWSIYSVIGTFAILPLIRRLSDKMMMALGIPLLIIFFLLLNNIESMNFLFFLAPIPYALYYPLFFGGYHMNFSRVSDKGHEGEEIGIKQAIVAIICFITPFIGGVLIINFGFQITFLVAGIILLISIIPLFFFPTRRKLTSPLTAKLLFNTVKDRPMKGFHVGTFGYATESMISSIIWPIFLFLILGNIEKLGGIISLGSLLSAGAVFFAGRLSDKGKRNTIFSWTGAGNSIIWFVRTVVQTVPLAVGTHVVGYFFQDVMLYTWANRFYELIHKKKNKRLFILGQETLYRGARILIYPFMILLAFFLLPNTPSSPFFIISFIIAALASLLMLTAER